MALSHTNEEPSKDLETQNLLPDGKEAMVILPSEDELLPSGSKHAPFLDVTRICCVACVAIDHGYRPFGQWNTLFAQDWVLQYLYLVSGVCFAMSKKSLLSYEARLGAYLVIGILMNWSGWLVTGKDWKNNMFNVIFHMWFIVGLMIYAALLAPLRSYLRKVRAQAAVESQSPEPETERAAGYGSGATAGPRSLPMIAESKEQFFRAMVYIVGGIACIILLCRVILEPLLMYLGPVTWKFWKQLGDGASFWGLPSSPEQARAFLEQITTYCMLTGSNIYLVIVCPKVFQPISFTPWAVFLNTYLHRMLWYRSAFERPFHGLDLMMLGITVYCLGMRHRRVMGIYAARYWFFLLFVCGVVWKPGSFGRYDEEPPTDIHMRVRVAFVEAVFILGWLVAAEHIAKPEIFTADRLEFLNDWALLVFLVHKAVHMILPMPMNWVFLVVLAPCCWVVRNKI